MSESADPAGKRWAPRIDARLIAVAEQDGSAEKIETDFARVGLAYAEASLCGQLFEFACKIVEPALAAPLSDDAEARRILRDGRKRPLASAIDAFAETQPAGAMPLRARLDAARLDRNHLAHEFWLGAVGEIVAGRAEAVVAGLGATTAQFAELTEHLLPHLLNATLLRGVDQQALEGFASLLLGAQCWQPGVLENLNLVDDGVLVLDRLALAVADGELLGDWLREVAATEAGGSPQGIAEPESVCRKPRT